MTIVRGMAAVEGPSCFLTSALGRAAGRTSGVSSCRHIPGSSPRSRFRCDSVRLSASSLDRRRNIVRHRWFLECAVDLQPAGERIELRAILGHPRDRAGLVPVTVPPTCVNAQPSILAPGVQSDLRSPRLPAAPICRFPAGRRRGRTPRPCPLFHVPCRRPSGRDGSN